jgi:fatty acid desaturase
MHEASHDLFFGPKYKFLNHLAGMLATVPLVVPGYFPFRKFHLIHHGKTNVGGYPPGDPDLPSETEYKLFNSNIFGRLLCMLIQPLAYSGRPLLFYKYIPTFYDIINLAITGTI